MKMLSSLIISLMIGLMLPMTALAGTFYDVAAGHDNRAAIEYLVTTGTLQGYDDGNFYPELAINRAELMKVLVAGQGIDPDPEVYNNCFPDVTDEWYARYVCYAYEQGWVAGYPDNTFLPAQTVNKVEASRMTINALGYDALLLESVEEDMYDDTDSSAWYAPYVELIQYWGLDDSTSYYYPSGDMTRGMVAEYLFRVKVMEQLEYEYYEDGDGEYFMGYAGLDYLLYDDDTDQSDDDTLDDSTDDTADDTTVDDDDVWLNINNVVFDPEDDYFEDDQVVEIENLGDSTVNLEGYSIEANYDDIFTFPSYDLAPGESVKVYITTDDFSLSTGEFSAELDEYVLDSSGTTYLYGPDGEYIDNY